MPLSDFESTMEWKIDITQFTKGMQEAKAVLKSTNSEFNLTSSTMEKWSDNITGLEAKIKQLGNQMEVEARMVELYKVAWEQAKKQFGETSPEAERLAGLIEKHTINFNKAETNLNRYSKSLNSMQEEEKKSSTAMDQLNKDIEAQERLVNVLKNAYAESLLGNNAEETERFGNQLRDASSKLNEMKSRMSEAQLAAERLAKGISTVTEDEVKAISKHQELTTKIEEQQKQVDALKEEYASAVLQYGKTSTKAQELGKQLKELSSDLADNKKKMSEADDAADKLDRSIDDVAESATDASNGGFTVLKGALANLVTQGINRVIDGFKTLTKNAVTYESELEGYQTSFETMTGSADKAAETVERLGKIAVQTPFDMPTLAQSTQLLMNFGYSADEAVDSMLMLGDISQGSADKMSRIALAYGQMSSAGKVHLQDIKQMIEAGFNPLQEISETTGESMESLYKRISKGTISVDEIKAAFVRATSEGGKYFKSMDRQSQTLDGRMTALQETVNATFGKVMQPLLQRLADKILPRVTQLINNMDTTKLAKGFAEFGDKAMVAFEWIVKNGGKVLDVIESIAVAFVTYKAVSTIATVTGAFTTLFNTIKAGQGVMKALNLAFGATPVGLLATGIAALAGGIGYMAKETQKAIEAEYGLNKEQQKSIDAVEALAFKYQELTKARDDSISNIEAEYGHINELKDEYNGLIDSNGKVKEGYEDRAKFILTTLAEAMGVEIEDIQKLIEKNGQLGESIDKVIEKKKAEAVLAANEELYNTAIKERTNALNELADAQRTLEEADKKRKDSQEALNAVWEKYNELAKESPEAARSYLNANSEIIQGNKIAEESYEQANAKVEEAMEAWIGYNTTIENYEGLAEAIISGDAEKIGTAMENMTNQFITAEKGNRESLERQVKNYQTNLENLETAIKNGTPNVTQEMVDQAKAMVDAANAELDKLPPEASATGIKASDNFATGVGNKKGLALSKARELTTNAEIGITPAINKLKDAGSQSGEGFGNSVGSTTNKTNAKTKGEELADKAVEGASSENGEEGGAKKSGSNFGEGFFNGIGSWLTSVWERGKELAKKALAGLKKGQEEGSPSKLTRQSGVFFGEGYALGIESMINPVRSAAADMAKEAVDTLSSKLNDQMKTVGADGGHSLIDGINSVMPNISSSVANLKQSVASANATMNGVKGTNTGSFTSGDDKVQNVIFNQTINSPKAVDRLTLYRDTNNMLFTAKVRLGNV